MKLSLTLWLLGFMLKRALRRKPRFREQLERMRGLNRDDLLAMLGQCVRAEAKAKAKAAAKAAVGPAAPKAKAKGKH